MNNKTAFRAAHLEVKQQDYSHVVKSLQESLAEHAAQMPDGDRLVSTIEPIAFVIRTKYIPGPNAPQGADKLTFLTSDGPSSLGCTNEFAEELAENLKQPGGFSLNGFLKKTQLLIGQGFDRLFTGKKGEIDFAEKENAYVLRKSGEKIPLD